MPYPFEYHEKSIQEIFVTAEEDASSAFLKSLTLFSALHLLKNAHDQSSHSNPSDASHDGLPSGAFAPYDVLPSDAFIRALTKKQILATMQALCEDALPIELLLDLACPLLHLQQQVTAHIYFDSRFYFDLRNHKVVFSRKYYHDFTQLKSEISSCRIKILTAAKNFISGWIQSIPEIMHNSVQKSEVLGCVFFSESGSGNHTIIFKIAHTMDPKWLETLLLQQMDFILTSIMQSKFPPFVKANFVYELFELFACLPDLKEEILVRLSQATDDVGNTAMHCALQNLPTVLQTVLIGTGRLSTTPEPTIVESAWSQYVKWVQDLIGKHNMFLKKMGSEVNLFINEQGQSPLALLFECYLDYQESNHLFSSEINAIIDQGFFVLLGALLDYRGIPHSKKQAEEILKSLWGTFKNIKLTTRLDMALSIPLALKNKSFCCGVIPSDSKGSQDFLKIARHPRAVADDSSTRRLMCEWSSPSPNAILENFSFLLEKIITTKREQTSAMGELEGWFSPELQGLFPRFSLTLLISDLCAYFAGSDRCPLRTTIEALLPVLVLASLQPKIPRTILFVTARVFLDEKMKISESMTQIFRNFGLFYDRAAYGALRETYLTQYCFAEILWQAAKESEGEEVARQKKFCKNFLDFPDKKTNFAKDFSLAAILAIPNGPGTQERSFVNAIAAYTKASGYTRARATLQAKLPLFSLSLLCRDLQRFIHASKYSGQLIKPLLAIVDAIERFLHETFAKESNEIWKMQPLQLEPRLLDAPADTELSSHQKTRKDASSDEDPASYDDIEYAGYAALQQTINAELQKNLSVIPSAALAIFESYLITAPLTKMPADARKTAIMHSKQEEFDRLKGIAKACIDEVHLLEREAERKCSEPDTTLEIGSSLATTQQAYYLMKAEQICLQFSQYERPKKLILFCQILLKEYPDFLAKLFAVGLENFIRFIYDGDFLMAEKDDLLEKLVVIAYQVTKPYSKDQDADCQLLTIVPHALIHFSPNEYRRIFEKFIEIMVIRPRENEHENIDNFNSGLRIRELLLDTFGTVSSKRGTAASDCTESIINVLNKYGLLGELLIGMHAVTAEQHLLVDQKLALQEAAASKQWRKLLFLFDAWRENLLRPKSYFYDSSQAYVVGDNWQFVHNRWSRTDSQGLNATLQHKIYSLLDGDGNSIIFRLLIEGADFTDANKKSGSQCQTDSPLYFRIIDLLAKQILKVNTPDAQNPWASALINILCKPNLAGQNALGLLSMRFVQQCEEVKKNNLPLEELSEFHHFSASVFKLFLSDFHALKGAISDRAHAVKSAAVYAQMSDSLKELHGVSPFPHAMFGSFPYDFRSAFVNSATVSRNNDADIAIDYIMTALQDPVCTNDLDRALCDEKSIHFKAAFSQVRAFFVLLLKSSHKNLEFQNKLPHLTLSCLIEDLEGYIKSALRLGICHHFTDFVRFLLPFLREILQLEIIPREFLSIVFYIFNMQIQKKEAWCGELGTAMDAFGRSQVPLGLPAGLWSAKWTQNYCLAEVVWQAWVEADATHRGIVYFVDFTDEAMASSFDLALANVAERALFGNPIKKENSLIFRLRAWVFESEEHARRLPNFSQCLHTHGKTVLFGSPKKEITRDMLGQIRNSACSSGEEEASDKKDIFEL